MQEGEDRKRQLDAFFDAYAARFNVALGDAEIDPEATAASFADCFIEASPAGVICGKNDKNFLENIPKGFAFYKSVGTKAMHILSKQITLLDALHSMVKTGWRSENVRKDGSKVAIDFTVIYFLQLQNGAPKIFAYIAGDEQKAMKENGLLD